MYAVRENIESMEKSGKNEKQIAQVSEKLSQGNPFSANLRCLNFESLWESMPPDSPKGFRACSKNLHWEKLAKSHEKVKGKFFCIHPVLTPRR